MKRFIPLIIIAIVAISGFFIDRNRKAHESQISGYFETQPTRISSRVGGRVSKILVKEGDQVHAGQPLIELEADNNIDSTKALASNAEQLKQLYEKTRAGNRPQDIQKQAAMVAEVQADLRKLENGSLPEEKREAEAKVEQARAKLLKLERGNRPEEIQQARAAMNQAQAHYQQVLRGPTQEEKKEFQARLDVARAAETEAKHNAERYTKLANDGAVSQQMMQQAQSAYQQATGRRIDAEEAFRRATAGGPKEEVQQALQAYEQSQAAYQLTLKGARSEDVDTAAQDLRIAEDQLSLVRKGPRREDIAAAKARLASAEATLNLLKVGNRPEDIAAAKAQWEAAQAQLASSSAVVKERTIVAATDGTIEKIDIGKGDLIAPSAQVVEMSSQNDLWIRVYVPESELAKIKVGDDASLQVDGINENLDGVVDSINHQGEFTPANLQTPNERGRQVFGVRLRLKKADSRVRAGMYATVTKVGQWPS